MNASVEFLDSSFLNWDHGYPVISEDIATYSRQGEKERVGFQNKQKIYVERSLAGTYCSCVLSRILS